MNLNNELRHQLYNLVVSLRDFFRLQIVLSFFHLFGISRLIFPNGNIGRRIVPGLEAIESEGFSKD